MMLLSMQPPWAEAAQAADDEFPDKLGLDSDAELLSKHDIDPDALRDEFGGQSPTAG